MLAIERNILRSTLVLSTQSPANVCNILVMVVIVVGKKKILVLYYTIRHEFRTTLPFLCFCHPYIMHHFGMAGGLRLSEASSLFGEGFRFLKAK